MSFLEIDALSAGYGRSVVLSAVSLTVDTGEAVAVVGRNGAGKTTLLQSVFGNTVIHSGRIMIGGIASQRKEGYFAARHGVSITPQGKRILSNLTVKENLLLGAVPNRKGHWNLRAVFDLFPVLEERAGRPGSALSGGQQQMLAIGRALLANPSVLLLDEPSEGLAPVLIDQLCEALVAVRSQGTGILIVEQRLDIVQRIADRFTIIVKGTITGGDITENMDPAALRDSLAL